MATAAAETPKAGSPLDGSPFRVGESARRERWWYADGIWLDQGPTSAVVGFVWTHWLADRGVQVRDGELGEDYARELYRAARREMGEPEDEDGVGGATTVAGARVLRSRGLVEGYYALDPKSIVGALLERGPVVAGLMWDRSLFEPADVD